MTADIVNLNKARKKKARAGKDALAAENRVRFGMPRAERERREAEARIDARRLEGNRRADDTTDDGDRSDGA